MIVYRVTSDLSLQQIYGSTEDPRYGDGSWYNLRCELRRGNWDPPELYILEPLKPRGDFLGLWGNLVIQDAAYQKIFHVFNDCCEMLPIEVEGERMWV